MGIVGEWRAVKASLGGAQDCERSECGNSRETEEL